MSRKVICVTTTKPSDSLATGGGSLVLICPHTGSIQSHLRTTSDIQGKVPVGVSSIDLFPSQYASPSTNLAMGFGASTTKKGDSYGMLFTLRSASLPPILNWKTRMPEARMSGLSVSPCGNYVASGGDSGSVYVWASLGGSLRCTVKAHYGEVTALMWFSHGRLLITGGADGVIHAFSVADLVDNKSTTQENIRPIRTWSNHQLPVTALGNISGGRICSSSLDSKILIIEVFSEKVLATLKMPSPIRTISVGQNRLYAGGVEGTIFIVDLNEYAMHQSALQGATIYHQTRTVQNVDHDMISSKSERGESTYTTELKGHGRTVTAITVFTDKGQEWLSSGDESGVIRVWDLPSRSCVRVFRPWTSDDSDEKTVTHPVTSITVLDQQHRDQTTAGSDMDNVSSIAPREQRKNPIVAQMTPLERFARQEKHERVLLPLFGPRRDDDDKANDFWDVTRCSFDFAKSLRQRRKRKASEGTSGEDNHKQQQIIRDLEAKLHEANSQIARWEVVSRKLTERLQDKHKEG